MHNLGYFLLGVIEWWSNSEHNHLAGWVTKLFKGSEYASALYLQHLGDYLRKGIFSVHVHW